MKKLPIVLFFSGLAIQFAALLGEHTTEIPFVLKIVAPSYCRAQVGLDTLMKNRILVNTNEGFRELAHCLILNMYELHHTPKNKALDFKIESISCLGTWLSEGTTHGEETYTGDDIRYTLSTVTNGIIDYAGRIQHSSEFHYHLAVLREKVEKLKKPNILSFCLGMFFIGSIIEIVAFFLELEETKKPEAMASDNKDAPTKSPETEEQKRSSF